MTSGAAQAGPTGSGHEREPGEASPQLCKDSYAGDCQGIPFKGLCASSVRSVSSVVRSLVVRL
ncbi:MAG: hypothetical protein NTY37_04530 [Methanothrix sp.]|nr:hypothetical protein [Methanothrix sp.]